MDKKYTMDFELPYDIYDIWGQSKNRNGSAVLIFTLTPNTGY